MPEKNGYIELTFTDGRTQTHYFRDFRGHTGTSNPVGLVVRLAGGHIFYPWVQIRQMKVKYNSDEYVATVQQSRWTDYAEEGGLFDKPEHTTTGRSHPSHQSFEDVVPKLSVVLDNGAELPVRDLPKDLDPDES